MSPLSTEYHIRVPLRTTWRWEQAKQSVEEGSSTIPMYTSWCLERACRCIETDNKTDCFCCKRPKKTPSQKSDHKAMLRSTLGHCMSCRFGLGKLFLQEAEPPISYPARSWSDCGPLCHPQGDWALAAPPLHWDSECHDYLAPAVSKRPWNSTQWAMKACAPQFFRQIASSRWGITLCVPF